MSPWLHRWQGLQLPVELIVGESGSGKSTLCELRLDILTGRPFLRNAPSELRDWHASIANSGGLHVTDNVQLKDASLRQKLSDEICRITTETDPYIEQRRLYTNTDLVRIPVRSTFAITSILQPFQNADLLQRSMILELDKSVDQDDHGDIRYDSDWKKAQLDKHGGRVAWVAHHLIVLHKFFQLAEAKWDPKFKAKHRLVNFEQAMNLMAEVFGVPVPWIPEYLVKSTDRAVSEADWVLEGLHTFALEFNVPQMKGKRFRVTTISDWAQSQEDFKTCDMLTNQRRLGRYLQAHKAEVFHLTGIAEAGVDQNRIAYTFRTKPQDLT